MVKEDPMWAWDWGHRAMAGGRIGSRGAPPSFILNLICQR